MGTTSKGFRYPPVGNSPNVPQDIQNLATDLDTYLTGTTSLIGFAAGWSNFAGGYAKLQGHRLAGNLAMIVGVVSNTNSYSGGPFTVSSSVPTSLRPGAIVMVHGGVQSTGSALQSARFDVGTTGNLLVYAPAGATVAANSFHTLIAVYPINAT